MALGFEGQPVPPRDPQAPHGREAVKAAVTDPRNRNVLRPAAGLVLVIVILTIAFPGTAESVVDSLQENVVGSLSWYYALIVAAFVGFALWMGLGRYGDIRLGDEDEEPEFSRGAWFAMLFAAGMGVGLVFWGVAEPLSHLVEPKPGVTGSPSTLAEVGLAQTYVHWGIHAWAIYAVVGLGLAYAIHRKGRPVSIRWALEPLLGERVHGRLGDVIDIAAIVGGTVGIATSLGLGVLQISGGLETTDIADSTLGLQIVAVVVISAVAAVSAVSGLAKGLKWISNANVGIAGALMVFVLIAGPTAFLLDEFVQSLGSYLSRVLEMTFDVGAFSGEEGQAWQASWSTFFWGSWISWAPLVGIFIARISRGRTVREFVAGVLVVPALISFLWFAVFGGAGLHRQLFGAGGLVRDGSVLPEFALFDLLDTLPATTLASVVAIVLIGTFLITSVNSGGFVLSMLAYGGDPDPPGWTRVLWVALSGGAGAALLVTGGLVPLQTATILLALPFSFIMIGIAVAAAKAFHDEHEAFLHAQARAARREVSEQIGEALAAERAGAPDGQAARSPLPDVPVAPRAGTLLRRR